MARNARLLTLALLAALTAALITGVSDSRSAPRGDTAAAATTTPTGGPITSAVTKTGKYLTDTQGRVVIFHGVNIVRKAAPYWPSTIGAADAAFLADEGFNSARIGWIWSAAEPSPGQYDDTYLNKLLGLNAILGQYGIRSFVDFHQDSYSVKNGGDGAPDWASLGSSSGASWEDFWDNKPASDNVGIQTRFIALWTHVAQLIEKSPGVANVIGIDPLNEPNPGSGYSCEDDPCPTFESGQLADFFKAVIPAIRAGGAAQVIWPESSPQHTGYQPALPAFSDPQTAYSWHYYCLGTELTSDPAGAADAYCDPLTAQAMTNEAAYGDQIRTPEWIGEFGANGANAEYAKHVDAMDAKFFSWAYWNYYYPSGDPSDFAAGSILTNSSAPGSEANADQTKLDALVVPYPQAIAGTPQSYGYDRSSDTMTLSYSTAAVPGAKLAPGALTQIFIPERHYPKGYSVQVTGGSVVSAPHSPWLLIHASTDAAGVNVTVTPATDSSTLLPSQTGQLPIPATVTPRPAATASFKTAQSRTLVTVHGHVPTAASRFLFRWQHGVSFAPALTRAQVAQQLSVVALPSKRRETLAVTALSAPHGRVAFTIAHATVSSFELHLSTARLWLARSERHARAVTGLLEVLAGGHTYRTTVSVRL